MALTPEQIKAGLKTLKPSQITEQKAPVIMPSTTTTTTNIMPKVTQVQPLSPKQNIMSPSLQVQSGVQPEKDYKKLATPQEIATFAKMIRAGEDPEQAKRGMQKVIDRRLEQENNARGQEPKNYVMTPEMFQAEQNKPIKDFAGGAISSLTSIGESVTGLLDKPAQALARAIAPSQGVSQDQVTSNIQSVQERERTPIGARITGGNPESLGYKGGKLVGDIAQTAMVGGLASKIPVVAGAVSKLGALGNAGKIAVGALEGAGGQAVYSGIADKRLPTAGELALGAGVGGAIPALGIAYKGAKKVLPKIADKADDAANKMLTNMNRITKGEQEKFAVQQGKTVGEWMNSKGLISGGDESIEALAKGFKASKDKADEGLSLIKGEYKNDYLSTMAREASEFADNTLSPQATRMKELADKSDNLGLTMSETNEVKRFFERNNKFTYGRDITAGEKTVRATNLDNYVRNRQLDIAEQNGFSNLKEINKDTQGYKYLLDKLIKNENGRLGNNAVTLTDWIVAGEVAANPQAIALLVGKKVASSNRFRKGVVKILNKIGNTKSEADRLVDIAKIQRIQNEKDLTKFLSLPYKKDANIPTYSLNNSNSVKGVVRPITPTGVVQETKPVLPRATTPAKKTIVEQGRATHNPYKTVTMDTKVVAPKKTVVPKPNNNLVDLQRSTLHTEVTNPLSRAEARTGNFETQFGKIEDIVFDRGREKLVIDGKQYLPSEVKIFERKPVADFDNILKEKVPVKTKEEGYISEIAKQEGQKASMLKQVSDDMVDTAKLSPSELSEYNDLLARAIQGRGENGATALEKLYNKFGKDVYGKTKTIVPVKQEVLQSTIMKTPIVPKTLPKEMPKVQPREHQDYIGDTKQNKTNFVNSEEPMYIKAGITPTEIINGGFIKKAEQFAKKYLKNDKPSQSRVVELIQKEASELKTKQLKYVNTKLQEGGSNIMNAKREKVRELNNEFIRNHTNKGEYLQDTTTAPKKQSVLPKPQEKQAVLEGKKELQPLYDEAKGKKKKSK